MNRTFNYYCDESTPLENDDMPYLLIAYLRVPFHQIKLHTAFFKSLRAKHQFKGQIKWTGVSESQYHFYADLIDYFFATDLHFRTLVLDKKQVHNKPMPFTDIYYLMYYRLINHQINMNNNYNIYFNLQKVHEHKKAEQLRELLKTDYSKIRTIQPIHAFESVFMQLTDFFAGALNYHFRGLHKVSAKYKLIQKIQKLAGSDLMPPLEKQADSLNLFFMDLNVEP
jgi:hypothetical protein